MRNAAINDYKWLYANTDYMQHGQILRAAGILEHLNTGDHVLEFGAGRFELARTMRTLGMNWDATDEATGAHDISRKYDVTVSIDVMEHMTEDEARATIKAMTRIAPRHVWSIANMSDVHNVNGEDVQLHTIRQPASWWSAMAKAQWPWSVATKEINPSRFWLIMEKPWTQQ
jgi:cyclopropane fatty-acyl-phospholipid synthase-like methyltransferase